MAETSRRRRILEAFAARLAVIAIANGFRTDAGAALFVAFAPELGPDDPDAAIAVLIGPDDPTWAGEHVALNLPIDVQALAKAELERPWEVTEDILADIKQAIELEDRTLGGLVPARFTRGQTVTVERESGSATVGLSITYLVPYRERWGHPEI